MSHFTFTAGQLTLADIRSYQQDKCTIELSANDITAINESAQAVSDVIRAEKTIYGINTGFGALAKTKIATDQLETLQHNLVLSHAAGTGSLLADSTVALILLLKINSLARGYSGIRHQVIDALVQLHNHAVFPCIPAKGSVGASGDLAPLAHMALPLIGSGEVCYKGNKMPAKEGLAIAGLKPLKLAAKEGLALLNGTQAATALALQALFASENCFNAALTSGALCVDAALASRKPFDERIQQIRGQQGQIQVAACLDKLLTHSEIMASHNGCDKVQDPYSLRCQPQVMGACWQQMQFAATVLLTEANAVSDNPLVFAKQGDILSGGNFHAEPVAMAADNLALAIAEIGALSERRTALLIDPNHSQLPAFLVPEPGLNSGFMIAQVTAAALASENKSLAHPACVDSLSTSANQEDHVSMATFAARRLHEMLENSNTIVAIELLAACQGINLRRPLQTSPQLQQAMQLVRDKVPFYDKDRYFAPDIAAITDLVQQGQFDQYTKQTLL